jgi:hypothetical protein
VPSAPAGSDLGLPGTGCLSLLSSLAFYCSPYSAQLAYGLQTLLPSVEAIKSYSILHHIGPSLGSVVFFAPLRFVLRSLRVALRLVSVVPRSDLGVSDRQNCAETLHLA